MENFQLYRTNILLSGQVKWNLILDSNTEGNLFVKDFHLSPISQSAPYNKLVEDSLLNYSHQENLKKFYKTTESTFFDPCIDPQLKHDWIILGDEKKVIYEDSFEAGPRNSKYSIYSKTVEILCPLWLELVSNSISFVIEIYTKNKKIASKNIDINYSKFGNYLYEYFKYLGLNNGVEDVLNVNLKDKTTTLTGISLESGNIVKKDISDMARNLLYRERTLLEFDAMLINNFANNKIITRQLFNFCFHFDINDLFPIHITEMMYGSELNFKIKTYVDGKELKVRDFYSNYETILRDIIWDKTTSDVFIPDYKEPNSNHNVLDYLWDHKYVNHINKNKYIQNTVHWSLNDNPEYIFNIYNGFGPYDINLDMAYSHRYGKTPDLLYKDYNKTLNNIGWCNSITIDKMEHWDLFISDDKYYEILKNNATDFKPTWVNNVLYTYKDNTFLWDELKISIFIAGDEIFNKIINQANGGLFSDYKNLYDGKLYYIRFKNTDEYIGLVINSNYLSNITFRGFSDILDDLEIKEDLDLLNKEHPLYYINQKIKSVKQIPLVAINKSLYIINAPSPSTSTSEIEYYKNDNASIEECYVLRYDGKIKPTFLTKEESIKKNLNYFKTIKTESEYINSSFKNFVGSQYPPLFPSIGYCAIEKKSRDFDRWDCYIPVLRPIISTTLYSKNKENIKIKTLILDFLKKIYPELNPEYIYKMYNIELLYDYVSEYNTNEYSYQIKLTLK